jgi:hypothetical protein
VRTPVPGLPSDGAHTHMPVGQGLTAPDQNRCLMLRLK